MILPTKHIKFSNSLLNAGAILLKSIDRSYTVSYLWDKSRKLPEIGTFDKFTLALDLLYSMGLVDFDNGLIVRIKK